MQRHKVSAGEQREGGKWDCVAMEEIDLIRSSRKKSDMKGRTKRSSDNTCLSALLHLVIKD